MPESADSKRAIDAQIFKTLGELTANVSTATKQTSELFDLVRELREETPSRADFKELTEQHRQLGIEQRDHMLKDMQEHQEFRVTTQGIMKILVDPDDDKKGLLAEHRELMETHNNFAGFKKAVLWLLVAGAPAFAAVVEIVEKVIIPAFKGAGH